MKAPEFILELARKELIVCHNAVSNYSALIQLAKDFRGLLGFIESLGLDIDFSGISIRELEAHAVPFKEKRDEILSWFEAMGVKP